MKRSFTTLVFTFLLSAAFGQKFKVDTLYSSGPVSNRVNVVILGDGFTEDQLPEFREEAKKFADFLLTYEPYRRYKNYFNFIAISTPSTESGVTNPGTAPDKYPDQPVGTKKTFYGGTFGNYIHRLVTVNYSTVFNVLANNFPAYDLAVMLVNTTYYGGSGGSVAVHTLHESANLIGAHEIGHSFGALNDEYWAGEGYGWEAPNMTMENDPGKIKWRNWLNSNGIGIHKHAGSASAPNWHKPTNASCLMEFLDKGFCAVCREATTEKMLSIVNAVDRSEPVSDKTIEVKEEMSFKLHLLRPEPNSLQVEWRLNNKLIASGKDQVTLRPEDIEAEADLTATVFDSTFISRVDHVRQKRTTSVRWELVTGAPVVFKVRALADSICTGGSTLLVAKGCAGTVTWSTGETGDSIQVTPSATTEFTGTCQVAGQPAGTDKKTINVLPAPLAEASNTGPYLVGETIEISASGGVGYNWSGPFNFRAESPSYRIQDAQTDQAGTYIVTVTDSKGCTANASTTVVVDPVLSADTSGDWVHVSPNPASDYATVNTNLAGLSTMILFDQSGNKMKEIVFNKHATVDLKGLRGLLLYRIEHAGKEFSGKLLVK